MNRYFEIIKHLQENDIRYLLAGGLASNLYGVERATRDIDLIIDFEKENLIKFEKVVKSLGFHERIPLFARDLWDPKYRKMLLEEKNMIAFSYYNAPRGELVIDLILNSPQSFETMWASKAIRNDGGTTLYLVNVEHLIEMKEIANRPQDQYDVIQLKRLYAK